MSFLLTIAIVAFLSNPNCVSGDSTGNKDNSKNVDDFVAWVNGDGFSTACAQPTPDVNSDCNKASGSSADAETNEDWTDMCNALSTKYPCGQENSENRISAFTTCCKSCPIGKDDQPTPGKATDPRHKCCSACAVTVPSDESVGNFVKWVNDDDGTFQEGCITGTDSGEALFAACATAGAAVADDADDWSNMCTALKDFDCNADDKTSKVEEFKGCCKNDCPKDGANKLSAEDQTECCATCIANSLTTIPTTSATKSAPGPKPTPTGEPTTVAPGPGPTPSPSETETTTGPSEESTENVTEPDAAFHLGASGLLVTLVTMMAAVVNIA